MSTLPASTNKTRASAPDRRPGASHTTARIQSFFCRQLLRARAAPAPHRNPGREFPCGPTASGTARPSPAGTLARRLLAASRTPAAFSTLIAACSNATVIPDYIRILERETGIEPATNSLEGCDSTTELLPLKTSSQLSAVSSQLNLSGQSRVNISTPDGTAKSRALPEPSNLEPMIRIELMTSPLPRECSTN